MIIKNIRKFCFFHPIIVRFITLGAIMQQLNIYQKHILNNRNDLDIKLLYFFLVSPKNLKFSNFEKILLEQGRIFIEIPLKDYNKKKKSTNSKNLIINSFKDFCNE